MNDREFENLLFTKLCEEFGPNAQIRNKFDYILGIITGSQSSFAVRGLVLTKYEIFLRLYNFLESQNTLWNGYRS